MSRSTDAANRRGYNALVEEARFQMARSRSKYFQEKHAGNISMATRKQLADAAMKYYDTLWEYRDKSQQVKQAWLNSDVDKIQELSGQQVEVRTESPGDSPAGSMTTENALVAMDPAALVEITKQLDYLANELGFAAPVEHQRQLARIGDEEQYE